MVVRPVADEKVALSQQAKLSSSTKGDNKWRVFRTTYEILRIWSMWALDGYNFREGKT